MARAALLLAGLLAGTAKVHAAGDAALVFGVFPYLPTRTLMSQFAPLRDHLAQSAGVRVEMLTAPDHRSFHERTRAGDYDFVFTAPILGHAAEARADFRRVAMTRYEVRGLFVAPRTSRLRRLDDLRGLTLAMPNPWATPHSLALEMLKRNGIEPGRDVQLAVVDTTVNAMAAVSRGDVDAGVTAPSVYGHAGVGRELRVIAETPPVSGFLVMAHPRVPQSTVEALQRALASFGETDAGKAYFEATGHIGWLPIDDAAMRRIAPLARYLED